MEERRFLTAFAVSANLPLGHLTSTVQNGSDEDANIALELIRNRFPRDSGPTDQEIQERSILLARLVEQAKEAAASARRARKTAKHLEELAATSETTVSEIQKLKATAVEANGQTVASRDDAAEKLAEVVSSATDVKANRDSVQESRDSVGAIDAQIRQFFDEIEKARETIDSAQTTATETVSSNRTATDSIIAENKTLQEEVRTHLLKAVGASLFSAFEKRRGRIVWSKWVWAGLTALAVVAQVGVFFYLAKQIADVPEGQKFYLQPAFFLRATATLPIIFFIGYAISQYAREREYEELYGFKSALSFSLSPYLDLIQDLSEEQSDEKSRDFAVKTVGQIFENPLASRATSTRRSRGEAKNIKDVLEQVIRIMENAGN